MSTEAQHPTGRITTVHRLETLWRSLVMSLCLLSVSGSSALAQSVKRISTNDAERLVAAWVKRDRPHDGTGWHGSPRLRDITPNDAWTRMQIQVFKQADYTESIDEVESYATKSGKAYPLSIGSGGYGLTSMCVCSLKGEAKPELAYTYSWGSGIHRSHLALFSPDFPAPGHIETRLKYVGDLQLKAESDHTVKVIALKELPSDKPHQGILVGLSTLSHKGKQLVLDVALDPHQPKAQRSSIWKY